MAETTAFPNTEAKAFNVPILSLSDPKIRHSLRPAAVWQEIVSYIKGSAEAMETAKVNPSARMEGTQEIIKNKMKQKLY